MKKLFCILAAMTLFIPNIGAYAGENGHIEYFVSPYGSDNNAGTIDSPFKTLEKARDTVRTIEKNNDIYIYLREGDYYMSESFSLDSQDSGNSSGTVIYSAYNDESVTLHGDVILDINDFKSVQNTDILAAGMANNVVCYDLKQSGISDFGNIPRVDSTNCSELFANDKAKTVARWPNSGYAGLGVIVQNSPIIFTGNDRSVNWSHDGSYIVGLWKYDWAVQTLKIENVDALTKQITMADGNVYSPVYGARYYAHNILKELDAPGEYYIDRMNGILYYYPTDNISSLSFSVLSDPIIDAKSLKYVNFKNIKFKNTRGRAVSINGYENGTVENCTIYNTAGEGIYIENGKDITVKSCMIHDTGNVGINVSGGNTVDLTPGNIIVENCRIYNAPRLLDVGVGGIMLKGVGNKIKGCILYDMPKEAIIFSGNEHIIEENEIYNVCNNANDCGAIYRGGTWVERGNRIRNNYIHDVRGLNGSGANGVYLDDMLSGNYVENNIFSNCSQGVFVHGGRDNTIVGNFVYNCRIPIGIHTFSHINNPSFTDRVSGSLFQSLYSVNYSKDPYRSKYPQLLELVREKDLEPFYPKNNIVQNNVIYNSGTIYKSDKAQQYSIFKDNIYSQRALYRD